MENKEIYKNAPEYCHYYFDLIETDDLLLELEKSKALTMNTFKLITPELENYSYEPGKWSTKEVIQHIIDGERVFSYRAFRFSRFDKTKLTGFEQTDYQKHMNSVELKLADLQEDYLAVRNSTISLFRNMNIGICNWNSSKK